MGTPHVCDDWMRPAAYWAGNKPLLTICCGRTRQAKNCMVQGCLEHPTFWCAASKGCNLEREIEAKRQIRNSNAGKQQSLVEAS